jgi:hypothetical protein
MPSWKLHRTQNRRQRQSLAFYVQPRFDSIRGFLRTTPARGGLPPDFPQLFAYPHAYLPFPAAKQKRSLSRPRLLVFALNF